MLDIEKKFIKHVRYEHATLEHDGRVVCVVELVHV